MRVKRLLALLLLFSVISTTTLIKAKNNHLYVFRSTYVFENKGSEPYVFERDDTIIHLFTNNRWQKISLQNSSHETISEETDVDGNSLAMIGLPSELEAGDTMIFSVEYVIESIEKSRPEIDPSKAETVKEIPPLLLKHTEETETFTATDEIKALAGKIASKEATVLGKVTRLTAFILENVTYCNFEVPLYPWETLNDRQGDCDDQAILLISMLRSIGIPALLQIGVVFDDRIVSERTSWGDHLKIKQNGVGWHGWTMVYIPPWGWIPIDMTFTGENDPMKIISQSPQYESYVVTAYNVSKQSYIGDSRRSREQLISSDLYISVSDKKIEPQNNKKGMTFVYIGAGLLIGGALVSLMILVVTPKRRVVIK